MGSGRAHSPTSPGEPPQCHFQVGPRRPLFLHQGVSGELPPPTLNPTGDPDRMATLAFPEEEKVSSQQAKAWEGERRTGQGCRVLTEALDLVGCLAPGHLARLHDHLDGPPLWGALAETEHRHHRAQLQRSLDLTLLVLRKGVHIDQGGHCRQNRGWQE